MAASNAILQELRIGKQCYPARIAGCLLGGSAPKPLKTRACALWLWRFFATNATATHAEMKRMIPALMRFYVKRSADGVVLFSFLCVWVMHNAEFSGDGQNCLNDGTAVSLR